MRILVVDPDPDTREQAVAVLSSRGHALDCAPSAQHATQRLLEASYDAVLLEIELPDEDGLTVLEEWRRAGVTAPILVLSANASPEDHIATLSAGADDHLDRPVHTGELAARVEAALRRRHEPPVDVLQVGDLTIDRSHREALCRDARLPLTPRELALLEYLALNRGRAVSRTRIAEHVWDNSYTARSNVIDVLVGRIRRKLEAAGSSAYLETVRGAGYALVTGSGTRKPLRLLSRERESRADPGPSEPLTAAR